MQTINRRSALVAILALAAVSAPGALGKAKPTPGAGTATACSAVTSNTHAKGGAAPDRLACAPASPADLHVTGSCDRTVIASADAFTCILEIHNDGGSPATFAATDILAGITVANGFQITGTGGVALCDLSLDWTTAGACFFAASGTIDPGGSYSFDVHLQAPTVSCISSAVTGDFVAQADQNGVIAEGDTTNNTLTIGLTANPAQC